MLLHTCIIQALSSGLHLLSPAELGLPHLLLTSSYLYLILYLAHVFCFHNVGYS